jgi:uncharacterized Zn-finger protein
MAIEHQFRVVVDGRSYYNKRQARISHGPQHRQLHTPSCQRRIHNLETIVKIIGGLGNPGPDFVSARCTIGDRKIARGTRRGG